MRDLFLGTWKHARIPLLALATVALMYLAWMGLDGSVVPLQAQRLPALTDDALGGRILVVSPHPDDEAMGSSGLIMQSLRAGKNVRVVIVTSGDGFRRIAPHSRPSSTAPPPFIRLGETRARESLTALSLLGLPAADVVFLGYPDGSMAGLWSGPWDSSHPKRGTNGKTSVPYDFALRPGAAYTGSSVATDLASVIASFSPSAVVYPDAEDENADHSSINAFTQYALDAAGYRGPRYTYLVHRGHFPFPWSYLPRAWLRPPQALRSLGTVWLSYPLAPDVEVTKERALDAYATQRRAIEPFLGAFVRRNELFADIPPARMSTVEATASLDATVMPGVVIRDPVGDTVMRLLSGEADIRRVAAVDGLGDAWLGIDTRTPVSRSVTYRVRAFAFGDGVPPRTLEVTLRGSRAVMRVSASADVATSAVDVRLAKGRVWVRIPASALAGARTFMVQAETSIGNAVFDRTAWRTIELR